MPPPILDSRNADAVRKLLAQGEQVHVANYIGFPFTSDYDMPDAIKIRAGAHSFEGKVFTLSVSIGLVAVTAETGSRTEVFSAADTACYSAKEQGRNRICVYHSSDADMAQRRGIAAADLQRLVGSNL